MNETPVLRLQRVPSRFFGFLVASPCPQGKLKKMTCIFHGRRNTLETSIVILRGRCRTLDVSCCGVFANSSVRAASSGVSVQIAWQACGTVKVLFFVGCAAFGEDPPCVECDFAW